MQVLRYLLTSLSRMCMGQYLRHAVHRYISRYAWYIRSYLPLFCGETPWNMRCNILQAKATYKLWDARRSLYKCIWYPIHIHTHTHMDICIRYFWGCTPKARATVSCFSHFQLWRTLTDLCLSRSLRASPKSVPFVDWRSLRRSYYIFKALLKYLLLGLNFREWRKQRSDVASVVRRFFKYSMIKKIDFMRLHQLLNWI